MNRKLIYPFLLIIFFGLLMFSCEKEDLEADEIALLEQYIKDNNITVQPTASGLYYIETEEGNGTHPTSSSQTVKVKYVGKLLNGYVFDFTKDGATAEFPLGGVILGWQEGLKLMQVGGKATLIIPSSIGYGAKGAGDKIPPYSSLIFEVELINVY